MNEFYVYCLLDTRKPGNFIYGEYNLKFEPFYVGKGKNDRKDFHFFESRLISNSGNKLKNNIINKIIRETKSNPRIEIIKNNLTEDQSFGIEKELISIIGRRDLNLGPLSNMTDGGEGHSGSISFIKEKNPFYGKKHKKESFKRISKPIKQLTMGGDLIKTFYSIEEAGRETGSIPAKISLCARGKRNKHNNFKWEYLHKEDLIVQKKKKNREFFKYIERIDIETDEIIDKWETIISASKKLNIRKTNIIECLKGRKLTAGGFKWKYVK